MGKTINIKFDTMKVVLAGASGSGKTTLAKALAAHFGWKFTENSAGLIMGKEHKRILSERFGYEGNWGQKKVINNSHSNPSFGRAFQRAILIAREKLMENDENAVYDRSSLDPIVFYLNQVVHNDEQVEAKNFIHECIKGLEKVSLIIRIPLQNPNQEIENNESRVNNWYFQKKIDNLFDTAIEIVENETNLYPDLQPRIRELNIVTCPGWEWTRRFNWAVRQIERLVSGNL